MSPLASKILIVGVPLLISLGWFAFWVIRLTREAKRLKSSVLKSSATPARGDSSPPPDPPAQQPPGEGGR